MSIIKDYLLKKFSVNYDGLSQTKKIACDAWAKFSEIAQPEIKTSFMSTIWEIVKSYGLRKTLTKNDSELRMKMLDVLSTMKPLLDDMKMSLDLKESNIQFPKVGQLKKIEDMTKDFTEEEMKKASLILGELLSKGQSA